METSKLELVVLAARLGQVWTQSRAMGLFVWRDGRLCLEASDGLHQAGLDYVIGLWSRRQKAFAYGTAHFNSGDERSRPSIALPCFAAGEACGLLYLETTSATYLTESGLLALSKILSMVIGVGNLEKGALKWVEMTEEEAVAAKLRLLMERHEWNVTRVARELGVTRMTIYNRLQRYQIERIKVRLTAPRKIPRRAK